MVEKLVFFCDKNWFFQIGSDGTFSAENKLVASLKSVFSNDM